MKVLIYSLFIALFLTSEVEATYPSVKVQQIVIPQKVVEFDARYFLGTDNYFSVGEKLRAEKQEEKNAEIEFYKGQIDMLLKILAAKNGNTTIPTPEVVPPPVPTPEQPTTKPTPVDNGDYKVTEIDKKVYALFKTKCARCHGDTKQDGGLTLIKGDALQLVDVNDRVEIYDRTLGLGLEARGKARMPKGGLALADDEVETLRLWMVQESDLNRNK